MKTIQQTLTGERLALQHTNHYVPISDIIWLPIKYFMRVANMQRWLFLLSFLTYGIGDGITAVYMMEGAGVLREINPIVRFLYTSYGGHGVVGLKIWFAMVVLFLVWNISKRENTYWKINGFLVALTLGGGMAMFANLMIAFNMISLPSSLIIMAYIALTALFVMIGDLIDNHNRLDKYSSIND